MITPRDQSPVSSRYGAPMGRPDKRAPGADGAELGRFYLRRVRLDSGGYDAGGAYWGTGTPLWWYADETGEADGFKRAPDRVAAAAAVREEYPGARFFREPGFALDYRAARDAFAENFDDYDRWGSALTVLGTIADELERRGADIPAAWGYSPGACGPGEADPEGSPEQWAAVNTSAADLLRLGNLANWIADRARRAGRDY